MRRELIINWSEVHDSVRRELDKPKPDALDVGDSGKGWSYVTFFRPGTHRENVLFDVNGLEQTAQKNGYFLPWDIISQHNKLVINAFSNVGNGPSVALLALVKLLEEYAKKFNHPLNFPHHGFYGKLGGIFERPEKGRVMALYATSDDDLLLIEESLQEVVKSMKLKWASFDLHLSNGLSDIPRMLDGYDDPEYRETGATHFRITDPARFQSLLDQARRDYGHYLFTSP